MLTWIALSLMLGLVGWTFGYFFILALLRMTGDHARTAGQEEKHIGPFSTAAITQFGNG